MIPERFLSTTAILVRPSTTASDGYGDDLAADYSEQGGARRIPIRGILQATGGSEVTDQGSRDSIVADWLFVTSHLDVDGRDRLEYEQTTFEVLGPVLKPTDPWGRPHHAEVRLRVVAG